MSKDAPPVFILASPTSLKNPEKGRSMCFFCFLGPVLGRRFRDSKEKAKGNYSFVDFNPTGDNPMCKISPRQPVIIRP